MIELLVVIAIIAILAGLMLPALSRAKMSGKTAACMSNMHQLGLALRLYLMDYEDTYPQTKRTESNPELNDADGSIEAPDRGSAFVILLPYTSINESKNENLAIQKLFACPADPNPFDPLGPTVYNPGGSWLTSYLVNGYFIWGMKDAQVERPSTAIIFSERRSRPNQDPHANPFSDDSYKPWFYPPTHPLAQENHMDEFTGAIQARRHLDCAVYTFCDGHAERMKYSQTFKPPTVNLHKP